ncbi:DUF2593 family protein [Yersinia nurmii]|uniref:DUF2593 family protein n=1 Tax=Yersinia nurmii TaxID=685706 RepID=A0AAW7JTH3_9GAMM|nr:YbjO family protein [Yersinia nurmii]MDN0085894.1 DUF2593 family protein [Yersinia nurmii]CND92525.1 putative inner membrane protein [Yersinia nurmii]
MSVSLGEGQANMKVPAATPVAVLVGGTAIIATRVLGLLLLVAELGMGGMQLFIAENLQSWDSGLILLASLGLLFLEIVCGRAVIRRKNWGRWCYLLCQIVVVVYMLLVSLDWLYVDVFRIEGESGAEVFHSLLIQKIPDAVIIGLLFIPFHSKRFFRQSK